MALVPLTGRPAAVQEPSPTGAGEEVKGVNGAGAGSGTGAVGASDVEVVVAEPEVAGVEADGVDGGRPDFVCDRSADVA
jgi:hypothetical protein